MISEQNKSSNYLRNTAKKSTPANNAIAVNTLSEAQQSINNLSKYFGYDTIWSAKTLARDIGMGVRNKPKNKVYAESGMAGILNIGSKGNKQKERQEDSILMLSHPENSNFKIALVADGMGGQANGDKASYIATASTMDWFKQLPKQFYNSDVIRLRQTNGQILDITFEDMIKKHLLDINNQIVDELGSFSGTTFSAAIMRKKNGRDIVTSVSIGDSKVVRVSNNGKVTQLSKDDNSLSEGMKNGELYVKDGVTNRIFTSNSEYSSKATYEPRKTGSNIHVLNEDDMRFYKDNNYITGYLGGGQTNESLKQKLNSNPRDFIADYPMNRDDKLILCSDGVSDTLTNSEIGRLMNVYSNPVECLKSIVNSIYTRQKEKEQKGHNNPPAYLRGNSLFNNGLKGSGDNISAVIVEKGDSDGR